MFSRREQKGKILGIFSPEYIEKTQEMEQQGTVHGRRRVRIGERGVTI